MKIAVEIPDVIYKKLINGEIHFGGITSKNIFNYVKNGIPIELPEKAEENEDEIGRNAMLEIEKASKSNWNSVPFKNVNELPPVTRQKINKIININKAIDYAVKALEQESGNEKRMTKEEAIDYIREWCPYDMQEEIIKALEQEPYEDAISRKVVMEHYSTGEIAHCHHISRNNLLDFIEQLPPVSSPEKPKFENKILKNIRLDIALKYIPESSDEYGDEAKWLNRGLKIALEVIDEYKDKIEENKYDKRRSD